MEDWPTLNRAQLDSIRRLGKAANRDLIVELGGTFLSEFPQRKALMQAAIDAGNAQSLELEAHSLLGICGHLGADKMIQLCERLERCGRDVAMASASTILDELVQEQQRFVTALRAYQSELAEPPKG